MLIYHLAEERSHAESRIWYIIVSFVNKDVRLEALNVVRDELNYCPRRLESWKMRKKWTGVDE